MASGAPAINLKINWGDDIRRITLLDIPSYAELRKTFQKIFSVAGLPKGFVIKYLDDEKDFVTIGSDLELSEALQFGLKQQSPLRLSIHESKSASKQDIVNGEAESAPLPQPASQSEASSQLPDLSQLVALIEQLPNNQDLKRGLESAVNSLGPLFHNVGQSLQHAVENNRPQLDRIQHLLGVRLQALQRDVNILIPELIAELKGLIASVANQAKPAERGINHRAFCDNCQCDIFGIRYHCTTCPDFDLCEACEAKEGVHDAQHFFLKLRKNMPYTWECRRLISEVPSNRRTFRSPPAQYPRGWNYRSCQTLSSRFVSDLTIEDGSLVEPRTEFVKVWTLRNDGSVAWPQGTQLVFLSGTNLAKTEAVSVPRVGPGEEVDIAVPMVAPDVPGTYVSYWRLATLAGFRFGHRIWAEIVVQETKKEKEEDDEDCNSEKNVLTDETEEEEEEQEQDEDKDGEERADDKAEVSVVLPLAAADQEEEPATDQDDDDDEEEEEESCSAQVSLPSEFVEEKKQPVLRPLDSDDDVEETKEEKKEEQTHHHHHKDNKEEQKASSASDDDELAWGVALDNLEQMGFANRELNRYLLVECKGDLVRVVHQLLGH